MNDQSAATPDVGSVHRLPDCGEFAGPGTLLAGLLGHPMRPLDTSFGLSVCSPYGSGPNHWGRKCTGCRALTPASHCEASGFFPRMRKLPNTHFGVQAGTYAP